MKFIKRLIKTIAIVVLVGAAFFFLIVPGMTGRRMNETFTRPPYNASSKARELHRQLVAVDLHADSLLWSRDLLEKGSWGHVDVPRLVEGNVALQVFTMVTKTPRNMNIESNAGSTDNIVFLTIAQRWPVSTWRSLTERALYQSRRLHDMAARSLGQLVVIRTADDLRKHLERRLAQPEVTAGLLGIEGAHALDGKLENLDRLFDAGVRVVGITHFFDNEFGGSVHGIAKHGLTPAGQEMIRRIEAKRMIVDLAHSSTAVIDEVLAMSTRPVIVSHSGVKGTCDNNRNLSDDQLLRIAKTGGVIGIGFWETASCGRDAKAIARAIRHAVNVVGTDHVALGSDYDGGVPEPFDISGLVLITEALLDEGFTEPEIKKVMGENALRVFKTSLP